MTNLDLFPDPQEQPSTPPREIPQPPEDRILKGGNDIGDKIQTGNSTTDSLTKK